MSISRFAIETLARRRSIVAVLFMGLLLPQLAHAQSVRTESPERSQAGTLVYSEAWDSDQAPLAFTRFHAWVQRSVANPAAGNAMRPQQISEGVKLARERKAALAELIKSDPERAIALSVPAQIRRRLPSAVVQELEERVSGIGEFSITQALATIGGPSVEETERSVTIGDRNYSCFVYYHTIYSGYSFFKYRLCFDVCITFSAYYRWTLYI